MSSPSCDIAVRYLGLIDYQKCFDKMRDEHKNLITEQIWVCEHYATYTTGRQKTHQHILTPLPAPLIATDRGGKITYHGPGQMVFYFLLDLKKRHLGVKKLVSIIEQSALRLLEELGIKGHLIAKAPGIYIANKKVASLGLTVRKYKSYHGIAINFDTDLSYFDAINPCGYQDLKMTNIADYNNKINKDQLNKLYLKYFLYNINL